MWLHSLANWTELNWTDNGGPVRLWFNFLSGGLNFDRKFYLDFLFLNKEIRFAITAGEQEWLIPDHTGDINTINASKQYLKLVLTVLVLSTTFINLTLKELRSDNKATLFWMKLFKIFKNVLNYISASCWWH